MDEIDDFYKKEIRENGGYKYYIANSLNKLARENGETKFSVSITFKDINIPSFSNKEIEISRHYDTTNRSKDEDPIIYIDGDLNELNEDKENGNQLFIQELILPKEIAKFFFFDAEKIVTLATDLNKAETRKSLSKAYSEILGIKKYLDLKDHLNYAHEEIKKNSAGIEDRKRLNNLIAEIDGYTLELNDIEKNINSLENEKSEKKYEAEQIQEKLIHEGKSITLEELESLREQKSKAETEFNSVKVKLKDLYEIAPFAIVGAKLSEVAEHVKLERKQQGEEKRLNDLKKDTDTILTNFERETYENVVNDVVISREVRNFFIQKLENILKTVFDLENNYKINNESREILHNFSLSDENELDMLLNNLSSNYTTLFKEITDKYNNSRNSYNSIKRKLDQAESKEDTPIITDYRNRKKELENRINQIDREIRSLSENSGKIKVNNNKALKIKSELTHKINASEAYVNKSELILKTLKVIDNFNVSFKEQKKKSLEGRILNWLNKFMHKQYLITKVEIDVTYSNLFEVNLYDQHNNKVQISQLSMGERQLFTSALLQGLVEESSIDFPVFIDSPMQKLDDEHSKNIIKNFYPNVSDQVVLFPLPIKEMTEEEYDSIKPYVSNCYIINNNDKNNSSEFMPVGIDDLFKTYRQLNNEPNI